MGGGGWGALRRNYYSKKGKKLKKKKDKSSYVVTYYLCKLFCRHSCYKFTRQLISFDSYCTPPPIKKPHTG